jgi:hypothetical protein
MDFEKCKECGSYAEELDHCCEANRIIADVKICPKEKGTEKIMDFFEEYAKFKITPEIEKLSKKNVDWFDDPYEDVDVVITDNTAGYEKQQEEDEMKENIKELYDTFEVYSCQHCGKYHDMKSSTFVSVMGNVFIGSDYKVIGNNFKRDGITLKRIQIYCRSCFKNIINGDGLEGE